MGNLKKNYICGCEHRMSRPLHLVIAMLLLISMGMVMTSCGSDDKDDEPVIDNASELYGTWFASETTESNENGVNNTTTLESTIVFNSQDKLLSETVIKLESKAPGGVVKETTRFSTKVCWYEVVDNIIKVYLVNNGTSEEYVQSYKIFGNNLILEYISGDKPSFLHGNRVAYINKSKVDILEFPYGIWDATVSTGNIQRKYRLDFYMDGELDFLEQSQDSQYLNVLEEYGYDFSGNKMNIYKESNSTTMPDCILTFKVIDDNITLEYISGDKPLFISVFNSDKATYEINK